MARLATECLMRDEGRRIGGGKVDKDKGIMYISKSCSNLIILVSNFQ